MVRRSIARRPALLALVGACSLWPAAAPAQRGRPAPATATPPANPGTLESALQAARASDYPRAEKELSAISGPDRPAAMLALARVYFEQGKHAEAERTCAAITAGNLRLQALALRAEVLLATGRVAEAIRLLEPHKDAPGVGGRRVRLVLGEALITSGKRADAEPILMKFADEYGDDTITSRDAEGLAMVGRAMFLLRHAKDANRAFNESERAAGAAKSVETLLWRAELFVDKYDPGHAEQVLNEALAIAPKRADALVLLARGKLEDSLDFDQAEKLVKEALAINPKHTGAYAVRAGIALRDMDLAAAEAALNAGLAVNPNALELLSLHAAARFLADDAPGYEAAKKETLARNPQYSQLYGIVGELAEWEHRYDDIVVMMKEAVRLDPNDSKAWAQLGLTQMRGGDEEAGLKSLEEAWKGDHFNVRVFNTLERLYGQWIPSQYDMAPQQGVFKIRYPKDEQKILERYVPRFMAEAWGAMKGRYMFTPTTPVQLELYADRQHFSVRTSGLPNIGIQGVCFGRVVAAMSPRSEPFNWGNVLWHELGHVFAIQLSKNHVPRWFTEGLSEWETIVRRPEWQRELDPEFYRALRKNALPGAVDMNKAFTHQSDDLDVSTAYYVASQMIAFTAERYGTAKIVEALRLWGEGKRTADVIRTAFGVEPEQYDAAFRAWAMNRLSRYKGQFMFDVRPKPLSEAQAAAQANPRSAEAHVVLAMSLVHAKKIDEARRALDKALELDPNDASAHFLAAKLAGQDTQAKIRHLRAIQAAGGDGYAVQMAYAEIAEGKKDKAALRVALEAAHRFDPTQSEPLKGLYELAQEEKRDDDALDVLRKLARIEQHDRTIWRALLDGLVARKAWDEAARVGEAALFVDIDRAGMHLAYARALSALGRHAEAKFELESALLCPTKPSEAASAHALLARELAALHEQAEAKKHLDEARRLDANNDDLKGLTL